MLLWERSEVQEMLRQIDVKGSEHSDSKSPVDVVPPSGFGWLRISG